MKQQQEKKEKAVLRRFRQVCEQPDGSGRIIFNAGELAEIGAKPGTQVLTEYSEDGSSIIIRAV